MTTRRDAHVLVTGGSQGLGLAMAEAFLKRGAEVTVVARNAGRLEAARAMGVSVVVGDATDADFMNDIVKETDPTLLVLNAGARLVLKPIDELDFEEFSINWNTDVKATLHGIQAAFNAPMRPGSRVLLMSSGVAMVLSHPRIPPDGSGLSGGCVGAKRMIWYMAHSANSTSRMRNLGIHFQALLPTQLMAGTEFGRSIAEAYAAPLDLSVDAYLAKVCGPPLRPAQVGEQVADIATDPQYASAAAYAVRAEPTPLSLDL